MYNDIKFNNVMIDGETGQAVCVIELDTVISGLAPYVFGDAVRAVVNTAAQDEEYLSRGGSLSAEYDFCDGLCDN